jgi:23S rRNA pseudouridine1911/1915/1917 synthase
MRAEEDLYVETNYQILFEDDHFLAVDKPAPLPVHPVGRFKEKNLLSLLKKEVRSSGGLQIVNRLDSETSGLVLVSKSSAIAGRLGVLFEKRKVLKEYQAVVFGLPLNEKGSISTSLGTEVMNGHHVRMPDENGEPAQTDYRVLGHFGEYALLKIIPRTGRTHQIRAHLSFMGHPVAGDKIYIDPRIFERYIQEGWREDMRPVVKSERLLLHATMLEFRHPVTGHPMKIASQVPPCFDAFLSRERRDGCEAVEFRQRLRLESIDASL